MGVCSNANGFRVIREAGDNSDLKNTTNHTDPNNSNGEGKEVVDTVNQNKNETDVGGHVEVDVDTTNPGGQNNTVEANVSSGESSNGGDKKIGDNSKQKPGAADSKSKSSSWLIVGVIAGV